MPACEKTGSCHCLLCALSTFQNHITLPTAYGRKLVQYQCPVVKINHDHGVEICCVLTKSRADQSCLRSVSACCRHPVTNIHDARLEPSDCRGDVFTAAMQVQQRVISKRVKSDTVSVDNVRKVSYVQHEQYCAKDSALWDRANDVNNRCGTTGVPDTVCPTGQVRTETHQSCSMQAKLTICGKNTLVCGSSLLTQIINHIYFAIN